MSDDDELTEKALESCLYEEIDEYRIISRNHEGWDAILTVLLALDRDHDDFLGRVLKHCCHMAADFIEDNGGLYQVLTSDEMLESDVGAEREERRAEEGFIAPSSAAGFLALARNTDLADILASKERDPVTHAYFRSLRTPSHPSAAHNGAEMRVGTDAASAASLVEILRDADVLPASGPALLLQVVPDTDAASAQKNGVFTQAMRRLGAHAADLHGRRMQELAYLANVLAAGCSIEGRTLRPLEAARAAVATCNLGMEHLLQDEPSQDASASLLQRTSADKLFRIGWRLLGQDVVLAAARAFENALVREARTESNRERAKALEQGTRALRAAIAAGKPWTSLRKLAELEGEVDATTLTTIVALLDECPSLRGKLSLQTGSENATANQGVQFIATCEQLRAVQTFLDGL
jgi:hypothetical protein